MSEAQFLASVAFLYIWSSVMILVLLRGDARLRRQAAALRVAAAVRQE